MPTHCVFKERLTQGVHGWKWQLDSGQLSAPAEAPSEVTAAECPGSRCDKSSLGREPSSWLHVPISFFPFPKTRDHGRKKREIII